MERKEFLRSGLLAGINFAPFPGKLHGANKPALKPFYVPPAAPPVMGPMGAGFHVKIHATQTNKQFSCMEGVIDAKTMGPAPHIHKDLDEVMFVQEGVVDIIVGKTVYKVEAGGWHLRPHGVVHTFWNSGTKPARFVDMFFNQDFEVFLEKMFLRLMPDLAKRNVSPDSKEAQMKMNKLYAEYGITMFEDQRPQMMKTYGLTK